MAHRRTQDSLSLSGAYSRHMDILGYKEIVHKTGYTKSSVYLKAAGKSVFDEEDSLKLDSFCYRKNGEMPYIERLIRHVRQMAVAEEKLLPVELAVLEIGHVKGVLDHVIVQIKCPHGDGGEAVTENERLEADAALAELERTVAKARRALNAETGNVVDFDNGKVK